MASNGPYTISDLARRLDTPQHRLIHLCEKGVIVPEVSDAAGRGSSREFSALNYLEFAVALRLRDAFVPVSMLGGILHVLREFGHQLEHGPGARNVVELLRNPDSPDLRVILSDGQRMFFTLDSDRSDVRLFGGVSLEELAGSGKKLAAITTPTHGQQRAAAATDFGVPEGSQFTRLELSVNAVARSLELD